MSEMSPENPWSGPTSELSDKPLYQMSKEEYVAWYLDYMKTVPEENIMMISGMPMEINDDAEAFHNHVAAYQQLRRQGMS